MRVKKYQFKFSVGVYCLQVEGMTGGSFSVTQYWDERLLKEAGLERS